MMVRAADAVAEVRRAATLAGDATITASWAPVHRRIDEEATTGWDDTIAVDRLRDAGATVHHGVGRLAGPGRVEVTTADGELLTYVASRGVVLNPGTRPAVPPVEGLAGTPYWTNRDAVQLTDLPGSLVVVGGGPIGCEMAQVFSRFGVRVTVVQRGPRLVPADEPEASAAAREGLRRGGDPGPDRRRADPGRVRRREVRPDHRRRRLGLRRGRRQAARRRRPHPQPRRPRPGDRRPGPRRPHPRGRRPPTGTATGSGRSATSPATARSRTSRCTSRRSPCATSWTRGAARELSRGPARDLHRSGDRRCRDDRAAGP